MLEQVDPIRYHLIRRALLQNYDLVLHQLPDEMLCAYQYAVMLFDSLDFQPWLSRPLNLRKDSTRFLSLHVPSFITQPVRDPN